MAGQAAHQRITVLGASGLLGTAIARELASRPVRLRLIGRRATVVPARPVAEVEVRTADLTAADAVADAVADADAVVHLAAHMSGAATWRVASDDPVAERVNVGLVHDLIDAMRARPRAGGAVPPVVVFAGSMSQVGRCAAPRIHGGCPDKPLTAYDRQKLAAERAIEAATAEGVVRGTTLRLATLYSGGTDATALDRGVVATMSRRAFTGQPLTMWHDGTVKRDLLCVDDAARAFVAALDRPRSLTGRHWLVGTGIATTIADLFRSVAEAVAPHTGQPPVPVVSVPPAAHLMPTDLLDFVLDPSAFERAANWSPRVRLRDGLAGLAAAMAGESTVDAEAEACVS